MPSKKLKIAVLYGGKSAEHDVSIESAKNVMAAMDKKKYKILPIEIDRQGKRHTMLAEEIKNADVIFPVLHGSYGEDGTMQGLCKLLDKPFVGCGVLGSAIGMDKEATKRLLRDAGIPTAKFITIDIGLTRLSRKPVNPEELPAQATRVCPISSLKSTFDTRRTPVRLVSSLDFASNLGKRVSPNYNHSMTIDWKKIKRELGTPVFIKPANSGSSVGISKAKNEKQFREAIKLAFVHDNKILIEEYIKGREIECAVLGNDNPIASTLGEVIPKHEFYSYEAKYIDPNGAVLEIPAKIPKALADKIQKLAIKTFKALYCEGMARVDFFLKEDGDVLVNEINTIPGFTKISMYPKLWEANGISYSSLIDKLIELAIDRHNKERTIKF